MNMEILGLLLLEVFLPALTAMVGLIVAFFILAITIIQGAKAIS